MIESTERTHDHAVTDSQKSDAQWIEMFARSLVMQWHLMVKTGAVTVKEGTVTQINPHSVQVVGIHGATHRIPFRGIAEVARVGEAEMPLSPRETQHVYEFAGFMARHEHLRLETVDDRIEQAEVRCIILSGITVVDTVDGVEIAIPFKDITHTQSAGTE